MSQPALTRIHQLFDLRVREAPGQAFLHWVWPEFAMRLAIVEARG